MKCYLLNYSKRSDLMKRLEELDKNIDVLKDYVSRQEGKKDKIKEKLNFNIDRLHNVDIEIDLLEQVTILFQKTSIFAREQAKVQIESLVTKCLQYVFNTDIKFVIEIEEMRNKANAEFYIISEADDIIIKTKPELSRGGGIVDIVSLALRIAFLQIHKPPIDGPLLLDEPAKHVSDEYIYNVGDFLQQTSEMFNRQILMVTHNQHLAALGNKVYRVELNGSSSKLVNVEN